MSDRVNRNCPVINIYGANRFEKWTKTRRGSRAIIVKDKNILITHEVRADLWMIPGGGLEEGETPEECCIRELEEETGYKVRLLYPLLTMNEYYEDYRFITDYFVCETTQHSMMHLTEAEQKAGLRPEWVPVSEVLGIFSRHQEYAATDEEKRGIYLREFTALTEYLKCSTDH